MARPKNDMSQIRQRGNSYEVSVLAGKDPLTGKRLYLTGSSTDLDTAKRLRTKFRAQVAEQKNARTRATFEHTVTE